MLQPLRWRPILEGPLSLRAWEAIHRIAEALREASSPNPNLEEGNAGRVLLDWFFAQTQPPLTTPSALEAQVEAIIEATAEQDLDASLLRGFTGVAWTLHYLSAEAEEDPCEDIDAALLDRLEQPHWTGDFDLASGLVGYGVYFLERLPRPEAARGLQLILTHLEGHAEPKEGGIAWPSPLLSASDEVIGRCYNLGVPHGAPGVIALLAKLYKAGVESERAKALLEPSVAWLLSQKRSKELVYFPEVVLEGREAPPGRSAWCYGDPGVSLALLIAARATKRPDWEREAIEIARHAAATPAEQTFSRDACVCHGAAGRAHLLNRFYQATQEEIFKEAAVEWFSRALEYQKPGEGVGGFLVFPGERASDAPWISFSGLLLGATGIALTLAAAVSEIEPTWDRVLLMS